MNSHTTMIKMAIWTKSQVSLNKNLQILQERIIPVIISNVECDTVYTNCMIVYSINAISNNFSIVTDNL